MADHSGWIAEAEKCGVRGKPGVESCRPVDKFREMFARRVRAREEQRDGDGDVKSPSIRGMRRQCGRAVDGKSSQDAEGVTRACARFRRGEGGEFVESWHGIRKSTRVDLFRVDLR